MEQLKWETKKVKVKDLIQLDINPRKISEDKKQKLVGSLEKFNLVEIPAVNTDLQIIGGNQRVTALLLVGRGEEEIDVRFPNRKLTKKEVKEYAIISNTHAGEFDFEILDLEFADISIGELGFEIEGWDDWKNKQDTLLAGEAQEDDFDVPVGGIETDIVLGDLFEIGEHRLLCGDSTDIDSVLKLIDKNKKFSIYTDPPYGINLDGDNSKRGSNTSLMKGGLNLKSFKDDTIQYAVDAFNITREFNPLKEVWWGANYYCHHLPQTNNWLVWDKRVEEKMRNTNSDCELAWVKDGHNSVRIFRHLWNGLIKASERGEKRVHPTQKPIELASHCFNDYEMGNIILDLFGGSGATMVACHQTKRNCLMMEFEPHYCDVIVRRMLKLDDTLTVKRNGVDETQKWLDKLA